MIMQYQTLLWITMSVSLLVIPTLGHRSTKEASIKVENVSSATVTLKLQKPFLGLEFYIAGKEKAENWHSVNISDSCHELDEEYDICTVKDLKYNPLQYTYCIRHTPQGTTVDNAICINMENGPSDLSPDVQHIIIFICVLSSISIIGIAYGLWRKFETTINISELADNELELPPPPYDEVVPPPPPYDEVVPPPPSYDEAIRMQPPRYNDIFPFIDERQNNMEQMDNMELDQINPENSPAE